MSEFYYLSVLCLCGLVIAVGGDDGIQARVVNTEQGPVRGYRDPGTGLFAFHGIPYATTPTGPHRFKAPLPPPVWQEPLEAVDRGIICPQPRSNLVPEDKVMQEDCLIANVFVPDTNKTNLPVYVYIHGGGFQMGYGSWLKPTTLLTEHDIIAVTFNYRLGALGFLCLGTEDAPGNAGMKDQVALLHWVKNNIASFGGNPNEVTIGGCSAGGAAVDLLILSKSAEGLFNKAIPESGANVGVFSVQIDPLENAKWFAKLVNFTDIDDLYALQEFYKTASLNSLSINNFEDRPDSVFIFEPCIERPTGEEMFLQDSPINIIKSGNYKKVPLLYGFTKMEGLGKVEFFDIWRDQMNTNFVDFLPADLKFQSDAEKADVAKVVKEFYFGEGPIGDDSILGYLQFIGDVMIAYPHLRSARLQAKRGHTQIYLYEYSFVDDNDPVIPHTNTRGADHCSQAVVVCDGKSPMHTGRIHYTEEFLRMSSTMKQIWANFIKTGNPVTNATILPAWPAVGSNGAPYMSLGKETRLKEEPPVTGQVSFWDPIYERHYREPLPPPLPPAMMTQPADQSCLS